MTSKKNTYYYMGLFSNLFGLISNKSGQKRMKILNFDPKNIFDMSYESIIEEFSKNPIAYRCVILICAGFSKLNFKLDQWQPYKSMIPSQWNEFWNKVIFSLLITGNAFIKLDYQKKSLELFSTSKIKISYKNNEIIGYEYAEISNNTVFFNKHNIIHIQLPHYHNEDFGISPTQIGYFEIKRYNEISNILLNIMRHGCRPSGIFSYPTSRNNCDSIIRDDLQDMYDNMKKGSAMFIVEGEYKWESLGMNPQQLEISKRLEECANAISQVYGVNPVLLGNQMNNHQNYKNIESFFVDYTIYPLYQLISSSFANIT